MLLHQPVDRGGQDFVIEALHALAADFEVEALRMNCVSADSCCLPASSNDLFSNVFAN